MRSKGSSLEGFMALYDGTGNSETYYPVSVSTKKVVDYELVRQCQMMGDRPHRGRPIGTMMELWPFDALKRQLLEHAALFAEQVQAQGYQPLEPASAMTIWGPYTEKVGEVREYAPEADNPFIPRGEQQQKAWGVWGYRGDELRVDKGVAFLITGRFMKQGSAGHIDEASGRIIL